MIASTGNYLANSAQSVTVLAGESFVVIIPMCPGWEKSSKKIPELGKKKGWRQCVFRLLALQWTTWRTKTCSLIILHFKSLRESVFFTQGKKRRYQTSCLWYNGLRVFASVRTRTDRQTDRQTVDISNQGKKSTEVKLCCYSALMYGTWLHKSEITTRQSV